MTETVQTLKKLLAEMEPVKSDGVKDLYWAHRQIRDVEPGNAEDEETNAKAARMLLAAFPKMKDPKEAGKAYAEIIRLQNQVYEETDSQLAKRISVKFPDIMIDNKIVHMGESRLVLEQQALSLRQAILRLAMAGHEIDEAISLALTSPYMEHWMTKNVLGFDIQKNF